MAREHLKSRLGFILLSAGCAIGIGNVWKFPYITGQNGGGIFVLLYLFFLLILGVPVMTMEFAMGRAAQKSPVRLYHNLGSNGKKWAWHGYVAMAGNYLLMMFYTTVAAWMLQYFADTARGVFEGVENTKAVYDGVKASVGTQSIYMAIIVAVGFLVCSFSLQKGLERVTKVMMVALLVIMVVLAVNCILLPGGTEGLSFYLKPSIENMKKTGIGNVIVAAMNQSFFTLSIGMGSMAIFGSYLNKERSLMGEAVNVAVLDTFVALVSGLIIFPACFAYNIPADSGPNLIFVTLPRIFNSMPLGRLWGSLFFLFLTFAALSTVFAVFENIIACCSDLFGWGRKKACAVNAPIMFLLSMPCILGFNLWSGVNLKGMDIMGLEDFAVSNVILPLGSLIFVLFCTTRYGWGWKNFLAEANQGKGLKVAKFLRPYATYVLPVIILVIFIIGLVNVLG